MKPLIILAGPTAVGKTDLSIQLAKQINGAIIYAGIQIHGHWISQNYAAGDAGNRSLPD